MGNNFITIGNDGPLIKETNYWETMYSNRGVLFFSTNAGAFRLLLPESLISDIKEMEVAKEIVVSSGPGLSRDTAFEILFDDNSESPYCLHFGIEQIDRLPVPSDSGKKCRFIIYGPGLSLKLDTYCWYRRVSHIPCMRPFQKGV